MRIRAAAARLFLKLGEQFLSALAARGNVCHGVANHLETNQSHHQGLVRSVIEGGRVGAPDVRAAADAQVVEGGKE